MPTRSGRLHLFVASTAIAGLVALAWAAPRVSLLTASLAVVAVLAAEYFSVTVRDDVHVSLTNMVLLVLILSSGPELAVIATLGVLPMIAARATDQRVMRAAFNAGQCAVSAAACGLTYVWLAALLNVTFPEPLSIVPAACAALVYSVVNFGLVAGVVSVSSPDGFWATFVSTTPSLVMQVPSVGIAVLSGVLLLLSPWAILFMAIPVLVARYSLLAFERLDEAYDELVRGFVTAIEMKDLYTRGHSERVSKLSVLVAEELGVAYDQRRLTSYAALLHDVGKVGVPVCIINKPGPLDDDEFEQMKQHPTIGANVLRDIDFLEPAIDIVRFHHERLDGRGYPNGVAGEELSEIVRIVTAVDAFDAMTSTRSYRRAVAVPDAVAELRRHVGRQFDGRVVEALAIAVDRAHWQPTVEFASERQLGGRQIPTSVPSPSPGDGSISGGSRP